MNSLTSYLMQQRAWSARTFGDGRRTEGICQHIAKELAEIRSEPERYEEWIDVMILAMDGFWRHGGTPEELFVMLRAKQSINFAREWPQGLPEDQPVEHVREVRS